MYLDFKNLAILCLEMMLSPFLTPPPLFEKVSLAIQEISTAWHIILTMFSILRVGRISA